MPYKYKPQDVSLWPKDEPVETPPDYKTAKDKGRWGINFDTLCREYMNDMVRAVLKPAEDISIFEEPKKKPVPHGFVKAPDSLPKETEEIQLLKFPKFSLPKIDSFRAPEGGWYNVSGELRFLEAGKEYRVPRFDPIKVQYEPSVQAKIVLPDGDPGSFVMPFGKYQGETLDEIYAENPKYLEWIVDTWDAGDVRDKVEEFLETK